MYRKSVQWFKDAFSVLVRTLAEWKPPSVHVCAHVEDSQHICEGNYAENLCIIVITLFYCHGLWGISSWKSTGDLPYSVSSRRLLCLFRRWASPPCDPIKKSLWFCVLTVCVPLWACVCTGVHVIYSVCSVIWAARVNCGPLTSQVLIGNLSLQWESSMCKQAIYHHITPHFHMPTAASLHSESHRPTYFRSLFMEVT